MKDNNLVNTLRIAILGAWMTIIGILLSGPPGVLLVSAVRPSGLWQGAAIYAQNYHPIQTLPFFSGFLLVGGYIVLMVALHQLADENRKTQTLIAVVFTTIFATLIFINYLNQTTFVPGSGARLSPGIRYGHHHLFHGQSHVVELGF